MLNLKDKDVNKILIFFSKIIFFISTLIFYFILQEKNAIMFEKYFGVNIGEFTMGRVYRIWYPLKGFIS